MQKIYFICCCVSQFIKHEVGLHSIWNLALSRKYTTEYENTKNDMVKLLDRYFIVRTMKYLRGFCTLKCPIFCFFNIKIFLQFKFQICAYRQLKKISQGGCATPPNVPKLGVSGVKDTARTNKDLAMSCYIQVEYSVFFRW